MDKTIYYRQPIPTGGYLDIYDKSGFADTVTLKGSNVIGRSSVNNNLDIKLNSAITSRCHGEIYYDNDGFYYRDLNSANGTYINDVYYGRKNNQIVKKLNNGDILAIKASINGKSSEDTIVMIFSYTINHNVKWITQNLSENIFEISIGRSENESLSFSDKSISKKHAVFFRARNGWAIADNNSTNGVFLNNSKIDKPQYLKEFDVVRILNYSFIFLSDKIMYQVDTGLKKKPHHTQAILINDLDLEKDNSQKLIINIIERSVVQKMKKKALLKNINLEIKQGELVLILGGSGAGKSTFLNAVMGYEKAVGKILHGDIDIYKEYELMKYDIGYVPQQDLLRPGDTTYDTLKNAAQMKMSSKTSKEKREKRVEEVFELLGLQREKNSLVSKLSGGQRKRLSIAVEFIGDPSLFFLDEPDSGLDGIMAQELMKNLRKIADQEKIVMVITHGPDRAAALFDKVIVLAKSTEDDSGHLAFFGSVEEAYEFFDTKTLEGVVQKINRKDEGGEGMADHFIAKCKAVRG